MKGDFPIADLRKRFLLEHPRFTDPLTLATQLGAPPDLRYLRDGLRLSRGGIAAFAEELDSCLRAVPEARLDVDDLLRSIDALATWIDRQDWASTDLRLQAMARPNESTKHPLDGYCLGLLHHWCNLFYTLEPQADVASFRRDDEQPYESLMQEFSTYVIAAQSTIEPSSYLTYCSNWWHNGRQPVVSPYDDSRLSSRVASASRAMRRITLLEYRALFDALVALQGDRPFHARVFDALLKKWNQEEQELLEAIARLLEDVKPGWQRPGGDGVDKKSGTRISGSKTVRQQYRDGYVRIADSDVLAEVIEAEDAWEFEILRTFPPSTKDRQKARHREPDEESEDEHDQQALDATAEADGQRWMPAADTTGDDALEAVLIPADIGPDVVPGRTDPSQSGQIASRWAQQHLRRSHFAHALWRDRLRLGDVQTLFGAMLAEPTHSESGPVLACLHAALATGRSLEDATNLTIVSEAPLAPPEPTTLCYHRGVKRWLLPVPPPAWNDLPRQSVERPSWVWLHLSDATGFNELLKHFALEQVHQPVKRLSGARKRAVIEWLNLALPDAPPSLGACRQFLFHRLLAIDHVDLGIARLITGQRHSHADSVAHYAHYDAPVLWSAYQNVWRDRPKSWRSPLPSNLLTPEKRNGYGARRVPTFEAVQTLFGFLKTQIRTGAPRERHNLYTAYTLCGLVLGLGMRPVSEPHLLDFGEGSRFSLFTTYLDKARTDYHRRVNAVPPSLATHLERYAQYLRSLDRFDTETVTTLPRFRYRGPPDDAVTAFRPSHFDDLLGATYGLELYSLRRFARTHLIATPSVEGEDVDAYMGHWHDRVSPHDALSAYPMRRLQWLADDAVEKMLKSVGFAPLWMPT